MHTIDLTKCGAVVVVNNADHTLKHYKTNASLRTIKQWAAAIDARAWVYSHTTNEGDVYVGIGAGTHHLVEAVNVANSPYSAMFVWENAA